jgi:spermidine/putrescine-binding protein
LHKQGLPLQFKWGGAVREISYLTVLKGAAHKDAAFKFLEYYATRPQQQAVRVEAAAYAGSSKDLNQHLPDTIKPFLTTSHLDEMVVENGEWGFEHKDEVKRRWSTFLSK